MSNVMFHCSHKSPAALESANAELKALETKLVGAMQNLEKAQIGKIKELAQEELTSRNLTAHEVQLANGERIQADTEQMENEHIEKDRIENEHIEKERIENERVEKERIENEHVEKKRIENEHIIKGGMIGEKESDPMDIDNEQGGNACSSVPNTHTKPKRLSKPQAPVNLKELKGVFPSIISGTSHS